MKFVPGYYPIVLIPDVLQSFAGDSCSRRVGLEVGMEKPPLPPQLPWLLAVAERLKALSSRAHLQFGGAIAFALVLGLGCRALWRWGLWLPASIALIFIAVGLLLLAWGLREALVEAEKSYRHQMAAWEQKMREARSQSASWSSPRRRVGGKSRIEALQQAIEGKVQWPKAPSSAQRGVSEAFFFEYLQAAFGRNGEGTVHETSVQFGRELEIEGCEYNYSTDFTLAISGLHLDIEIDECYAGKGKKFVPTHCSDEDKDRRRDRFFLERGWVAIRFAEEQVVRYPQSCCKVIAQVLAQLTGERALLAPFERVEDVPLVRQWSRRESRQLWRNHFRKRLLAEIGIDFSRGRKKI